MDKKAHRWSSAPYVALTVGSVPRNIGSFLNYASYIGYSKWTINENGVINYLSTILRGADPTVIVQRPPGAILM